MPITKEAKRAYDRARYLQNRPQTIAAVTAWRKRNPQKALSYGRIWKSRNREHTRTAGNTRYHMRCKEHQAFTRMAREYGLSKAEYTRKNVAQNGLCMLCNKPQGKGRRLAVDHCHARGCVRDLLCNRCNMGLGYFLEDPDVLRKAAAYIERHRAKP